MRFGEAFAVIEIRIGRYLDDGDVQKLATGEPSHCDKAGPDRPQPVLPKRSLREPR
jgi:hypothetical protein